MLDVLKKQNSIAILFALLAKNYFLGDLNMNRRKKLVSGKCDCCSREAKIPWKGSQYCYFCWNAIWFYIMEETNDKKDKEATQKAEAEAESEKEQKSVKGNRTYGKKLFEGLLPFAN